MSTLTKISIVVLVVLVLFAVPVMITQATVGPNYRDAFEQEQKRSALFEASASQNQLAYEQAQRQLQEALARADKAETEKQRDAEALQAQLTTAQSRAANLETELSRLNTELTALRKDVEFNTQRTGKLAQDLSDSRLAIDKLNETNSSLTEQLKRSQAEYERIDAIARVRHEQNVDLQEQVRQLSDQLRQAGQQLPAGAGPAASVASDVEIAGTITAVDNDMASINVGAAKGVKEGMKLVIYRGDKFVGNLQVAEVQPDQAAGIITQKQVDVLQGDKVTSRLLK